MAEFIYGTSFEMAGPWLIESDRLEALDSILSEQWERLSKRNEDRLSTAIDDQLDKSLKYRFESNEPSPEEIQSRKKEIENSLRRHPFSTYDAKREITIYLSDNNRIKVTSFREAFLEPDLIQEIPRRFEMKMKCGEITSEMSLAKYGNKLEVAVSPEALPESREVFAELHRWARSNRPPKWQQLWKSLNGLQWLLWILILMISTLSVQGSSKNLYKEEAAKLLQDGMSKDQESRALEIILALQSEYSPPAQRSRTPFWLTLLFYGGFVVCLATSFSPKNTLGIGRGQDSISRWRFWVRLIFYLVPGFVFLNVVWPLLANRLLSK